MLSSTCRLAPVAGRAGFAGMAEQDGVNDRNAKRGLAAPVSLFKDWPVSTEPALYRSKAAA